MTDACRTSMLVERLREGLSARGKGPDQAMLTHIGSHGVRTILTCTRELFIILAVGVLGSQLLLTLNGGVLIGTEAQASSHLADQRPILISAIDLDLDPGNPAALRSVYLRVNFPGGGAPVMVNVSPTPNSPTSYACFAEIDGSWRCPTPGLKVVELEQIVVSGS